MIGAKGGHPIGQVAIFAGVGLLALLAYLPGLPGDFVYDDHRLITGNDGLKRPFDARRAFLRDYYASDLDRNVLGYYRPIAILSNEIDWRRGGGRPDAFHATNIALHVGASLLVLSLGLLIFEGSTFAAAAAAALFALHPAHAESVAFISGRVDPLAALFALGTVLLHLRASSAAKPIVWRVGAGGLWLLALLSKEMAVTAPLACLLLESAREGLPRRQGWLPRIARYVPYAAVLLIYLPLRTHALGWLVAPEHQGATFSLTRPFVVAGSYLAWLFLPPPGLHLEPEPVTGVLAFGAAAMAVAAVVLASALALRRRRLEGALLGWAIVALAPVAQLKPIETTLSERFLYWPSVAVMLLVGSLLARRFSPRVTSALFAGILVLASAYALTLVPRARLWRSETALWAAKGSEEPSSIKAWLNLARAHASRGERDAARAAYEKVRPLVPDPGALDAEMASLLGPGALEDPIAVLQRSLASNPKDGGLWNNLGFLLYQARRFEEAKKAFTTAIEIVPARDSAWLGLALSHLEARDYEKGIESASRAVSLNPSLDLAWIVLAECQLKLGRACEALVTLRPLDPRDPEDRASLERVLAAADRVCRQERP